MHRLATIGLLCGAALALSGCYVGPPGPGYYRPPGVYAAPRAYSYGPYGYGYRGYGSYYGARRPYYGYVR